MNNNEIVREVIKKDGIDEGMEHILELLMAYNLNDEEWLNNVITHLCYHSIRDEEEWVVYIMKWFHGEFI